MTTLLTIAIALPTAFAKAPIGDMGSFPVEGTSPEAPFANKGAGQDYTPEDERVDESIIDDEKVDVDVVVGDENEVHVDNNEEEIIDRPGIDTEPPAFVDRDTARDAERAAEDAANRDKGQIDLIAVVDAREIQGDIALPSGPVAVFSMRDMSMVGDTVNSVYVQYDAVLNSFGPDSLMVDEALDMDVFRYGTRGITILITSETNVDAVISITEDAEMYEGKRPVLVDSTFLNARVDAPFAMLVADIEGGVPVTAHTSAFPVDADHSTVADYLMAPVDQSASVGYLRAAGENTDNAWHGGINLGADWMNYVAWEQNAPQN